jgi:molybdate transport system ATP-binding protein
VPPHQRRIGYVFQDARLFPHMNVAQNLRYGGTRDEARLITLLDLEHLLKRRPAGLSGGEKQRVALARALMRGPELIVMDEPMASLDAARKAEVLPYLENLRDLSDAPILYVSHAMSEVSRLAGSIVLLRDGQVADFGPINDVLGHPQNAGLLVGRDAGVVIDATVTAHDPQANLTTLGFAGGALRLAGQRGQVGQVQRLRIPAADVILSLTAPTGISALNVLAVEITHITEDHTGGVLVGLQAGDAPILAQITAHSAQAMQLVRGQNLFAIVKATAMAPA